MSADAMLEVCRPVPGWMHDDELRWLYDQATRCRLIVEVGVWQGKSTLALCLGTAGKVLAVDHWRGSHDELDSHQKLAATAEGRRDLFLAAMGNLHPFIDSGRCLPIALPSLAAAELLAPWLRAIGGADMIFVDGGHGYQVAKDDLVAWPPLLAKGGLFCGHDRDHGGVAAALAEVLGTWTNEAGAIWSKRL